MTPLTKKFVAFIILAPIVFFWSILAFYILSYKWYHSKIYPYDDLDIAQNTSSIVIGWLIGWFSWNIIQTIDKNKKKIIFTLTGSTEEIKSNYEFPVNWNIGYEMCYKNQYGQYCFGETK